MMYQSTMIALLLLLCTSGIMLGIFFGSIYPDIKEHNSWHETKCSTLNLTSSAARCCTVNPNSCACTACVGDISCDPGLMLLKNISAGTCCGGSCCSMMCPYECNCVQVCTGSGSFRVCVNKCKTCERCCAYSTQRCAYGCGTCMTWRWKFVVESTTFIVDKTFTCGRDDARCNQNIYDTYSPGASSVLCYYNLGNLNEIHLDNDIHWNVAAWVFFSIFSLVFLPLFGFLMHKLIMCASRRFDFNALHSTAHYPPTHYPTTHDPPTHYPPTHYPPRVTDARPSHNCAETTPPDLEL
jgi:hypothetical protein